MSDGAVRRSQYWNVTAGTVRTGATGHGESLTDMDGYVAPMDRARGTGLFLWGVAEGLSVVAVSGQSGVTVRPGSALDAAGRMVLVTVGGVVVVDPDVDPGQILDVPTRLVPDEGVSLPTAEPAADLVLTLTWREVQGESTLANAPALLHAPWLRLLPAAGFQDIGEQVVLAQVSVDDAGLVTKLAPGSRRLVGVPVGRFRLRAPKAAGMGELGVNQIDTAEITTDAAGGVRVNLLTGRPRTALSIDGATADAQLLGSLTVSRTVRVSVPGGQAYEMSAAGDGRWHVRDVTASADRLVVDQAGNLGIGIGAEKAQRTVHVEGGEVHSGGGSGGFSFADRSTGSFMNVPSAGQRWVWYALDGSARLWSAFDRISVSATGEGGGLDVARRMRVRQGGDASAGIWFLQSTPNADRAFVGMADDTHVGFWGNTGAGWGLLMDTSTRAVLFGGDFGRPDGPATLSLFGSRLLDTGGGVLAIRSGGGVVAFDGGGRVGINTRAPEAPLDVVGSATGIIGRGGNGVFQAGVHGIGNFGVWADGSNNGILAVGPNYAGIFWGRVQISGDLDVRGTIFKGGGGFRIDHPLAPKEKYLSHSFVESPDMATLYTGTAVTDDVGLAVVELPGYFDALNDDPRVQLTTVGALTAVTLDAPVADGRFTIRTADPGVTVCWLVTGVRVDAWAQANRIAVEAYKEPAERERFLHAAELGHPAQANLMGPDSPLS
ncbi:hypothetical protein [Micromonospora sp. NPDC005299]|uniref:hypothetical protein n=1 Tax=Micromonospora sp. NPDC005299 TaxID=3364231 RepID=UPI00368FA713